MRVNGAAAGGNRGMQNRKGVAGLYAMKYSFRQNVKLAQSCILIGLCGVAAGKGKVHQWKEVLGRVVVWGGVAPRIY